MYQFWGYPYDKEKRKSECPQWKMNIHRLLGLGYVILYIIMMTHMVPRLWQYQVEFPARTVAHIMLGTSIGFILIIKLSILRWFRHFEEWMPALGTLLLLCTVLLTVLSVPFFFKETALASGTIGDTSTFSEESRNRVLKLLEGAGLEEGTDLNTLTTLEAMKDGRKVLLKKCVFCHDLKTAIDRPRTPTNWVRVTKRMSKKPTLGDQITAKESEQVAAYLIAITPDLQKSAKEKRKITIEKQKTETAVSNMALDLDTPSTDSTNVEQPNVEQAKDLKKDATAKDIKATKNKTKKKASTPDKTKLANTPDKKTTAKPKETKPKIDPKVAASTFKEECSLCHGLSDIDAAPPKSKAELNALLKRMVNNGFEADQKTIKLIRFHMARKYL